MTSPELPSWKGVASESNRQVLSEFSQKPVGAWNSLACRGFIWEVISGSCQGRDGGRKTRQGRKQTTCIYEQFTTWGTTASGDLARDRAVLLKAEEAMSLSPVCRWPCSLLSAARSCRCQWQVLGQGNTAANYHETHLEVRGIHSVLWVSQYKS